jgi:hypothetical protein
MYVGDPQSYVCGGKGVEKLTLARASCTPMTRTSIYRSQPLQYLVI